MNMELKDPRSKGKFIVDAQPAFPIFIESEIGLSIDNWVPIVCTGVYNGRSVIVNSPAEISALHSMGNFGKGSNSRSRPNIVRNHPKLPPFMRERQYVERTKWTNVAQLNKAPKKPQTDTSSIGVITELHALFKELLKRNIITKNSVSKDVDDKLEIIDLLSSDEEGKVQDNINLSQSINNPKIAGDKASTSSRNDEMEISNDEVNEEQEVDVTSLKFPSKSVIVLPDSDIEKDDYFKDLKPKLCIDESNLYENLILTLEEAYFLAFGLGCLQILDESKNALSLEDSWSLFCNSHVNFSMLYIVYHHFRSKGWIVKPGIKFGGDFLLYKKGQPFYHASYIVLIQTTPITNQSQSISQIDYDWTSIQNFIRMSATTGKEIIFASIVIPNDIKMEDLKRNPNSLERISVCETLLRRWISSQRRKDGDPS